MFFRELRGFLLPRQGMTKVRSLWEKRTFSVKLSEKTQKVSCLPNPVTQAGAEAASKPEPKRTLVCIFPRAT